jgi:DNA-binding NtrC family response regulator
MDTGQTILIVDPETDFLAWAQHQLQTPTTRVITATSADDGYKVYAREEPDLLISETHLSPFSGLELLVKVRQRNPNAVVILTSQFGTTQSVIESMKLGAFDFVRKEQLPFNLKIVVDAALKAQAELRAATTFKPTLTVEQYQDSIVGQVRRDAAGLQNDRSRVAQRRAGHDHRRERLGQGTGRARHSSLLAAQREKLRRDQLRRDPRATAGERTLRP